MQVLGKPEGAIDPERKANVSSATLLQSCIVANCNPP
jgi:hypothetical protein